MSSYNCGDQKDSLMRRLNKRVTIKQLTTTTDSHGQPMDTWTDVATLWAGIEPLRGREFFAAKAENAEVTTRIRIRYREGIDRTMVVGYKSTEFEILYIIHPEFGKRELQLMCKERQ